MLFRGTKKKINNNLDIKWTNEKIMRTEFTKILGIILRSI